MRKCENQDDKRHMKVTDRHRFEFHNASDQCFKAAADECRQIKYRECDSLERQSPLEVILHLRGRGGGGS